MPTDLNRQAVIGRLVTALLLSFPTPLICVSGLAAGSSVIAWGDNTYGQTNVPSGLTNIIAIAAGYDTSLVLKGDGTMVSWGVDSEIPAGFPNLIAVSAGFLYNVGLRADRTLAGWGFFQVALPLGVTNVAAVAAGSGW